MTGEFTATLTDHLGSGATTRTSDGTTHTQAHTPFGVIRGGGTNTLLTDRTFTGQTDDPGTGLIDYNARAYDPQLGRFIMADTILSGGGQLLNRYSYVGNNPVVFTDPSGHEPCIGGGPGCFGATQSVRDFADAGGWGVSTKSSVLAGVVPSLVQEFISSTPDLYRRTYYASIYQKGNGSWAFRNRIGGRGGPRISSRWVTTRSVLYGSRPSAGLSRVGLARSLSRGLFAFAAALDARNAYRENNVAGRDEFYVVGDTVAETVVTTTAGLGGAAVGCPFGAAAGTASLGPGFGTVGGCFLGGAVAGGVAATVANSVYDSATDGAYNSGEGFDSGFYMTFGMVEPAYVD